MLAIAKWERKRGRLDERPISIDSIRTFLISTHRDISNPNGMPNPELTDFQLRQVTAYILSLRNTSAAQTAKPEVDQSGKPSAEAGTCRAEIVRLELALSRARASRQVVGSAPESLAARLHRQPTLESVAQAATEAEKGIETALVQAWIPNAPLCSKRLSYHPAYVDP